MGLPKYHISVNSMCSFEGLACDVPLPTESNYFCNFEISHFVFQ